MIALVLGALPFLTVFLLLRVVATADTAGQKTRKPASWIKPQQQMRKDYGTEAEQRLFGESVKARQLQPLVCLADGTLVCGYRRYSCGLLVGMTEFDVTILTERLTDSQIKVYRLTENIQRKDLTPYELWQSCAELMALNPQWQLKDLASHLHFDPASITRYLSPSKVIPAWQEALREGRVGISDVYQASQLDEAGQQRLLELKLAGATRDEIAAHSRKARSGNGTTAAVKVAKVRCQLPSGLQVLVSGNGISLDESIDALGEAIKEMKRARDLGYTAKTFAAAMRDKSKRG